MHVGEVVAQLRAEGCAATHDRVRHARKTGQLWPRPRKESSGRYAYTKGHLQQLRCYMVRTRRGPKPRGRRRETLPVEPQFDAIIQAGRDAEMDAFLDGLIEYQRSRERDFLDDLAAE